MIHIAVLAVFLLSACTSVPAATTAPAATVVPAAPTAAPTSPPTAAPVAMNGKIRLALLPIVDALPIYVAQERGYFAALGIEVEFVPVASAAERDQVMMAGQADGMINDLVSVMMYNRDAVQVRVMRTAQRASMKNAMYRVVASSQSGLKTAADLKGVEIGVSQGTVIEYMTYRLLEAEGLTNDDVRTLVVPGISDRLSLLASGQLNAATLPEPFATIAVQGGGVIIVDDSMHPEFGNSVITFRTDFLNQNPALVEGFLTAIDQAVKDINADPKAWATVLRAYKLLPEPMIDTYQVPAFPESGVPTQDQYEDAQKWALEKGLIQSEVPYSDSVKAPAKPSS